MGQPVTGDGARPYWTTGAIGLVPSLSRQAIAWEQEAARVTFDLDPVLLTETAPEVIPSATMAERIAVLGGSRGEQPTRRPP